MERGAHRLVVEVTSRERAEFHVRFRRKHSTVETEQLMQHALTQNGNSERGRAVFFDAEKSQCIKCHRLGTEGGQIGPELTGVGGRFSRIHLIESLLEPSRTIAPSFEAVAVALADGRVFSGVRVEETDRTVTLGDEKGQRYVIEKSEIDVVQPQKVSLMPDNLATRLSRREFVDLIAFLVAQKQGDSQRER